MSYDNKYYIIKSACSQSFFHRGPRIISDKIGQSLHSFSVCDKLKNKEGGIFMGRFIFSLEKSLDTIPMGSSLIVNLREHPALSYGKLRAIFGEPTCETIDLEEQFYYCLTARDAAGACVSIYAYSGASGPAIGGLQDAMSKSAAEELSQMVKAALPADYDYVGYYLDGPCKVMMGVKDGIPYFREEECSEEEIAASFNR